MTSARELDLPDELIEVLERLDMRYEVDATRWSRRARSTRPCWVVEVLSPSTKARDVRLKRDIYERSGVRHYLCCTRSPGR